MSYIYNENPAYPSLESLRTRLHLMDDNRLNAGYECYTGHRLSDVEAKSLNQYVIDALRPTVYNDQEALNGILDRRHQSFVMIAEEWVYVVGLGRYAHPEEAKSFKNSIDTTATNV